MKWLSYFINNFFEPFGYKLNGHIEWIGEDSDDTGYIDTEDNAIEVKANGAKQVTIKPEARTLFKENGSLLLLTE